MAWEQRLDSLLEMVIFWLHVSWLEITSYDYQTMGVLALQPSLSNLLAVWYLKIIYIYIYKRVRYRFFCLLKLSLAWPEYPQLLYKGIGIQESIRYHRSCNSKGHLVSLSQSKIGLVGAAILCWPRGWWRITRL